MSIIRRRSELHSHNCIKVLGLPNILVISVDLGGPRSYYNERLIVHFTFSPVSSFLECLPKRAVDRFPLQYSSQEQLYYEVLLWWNTYEGISDKD
jgi:hypothetical protein